MIRKGFDSAKVSELKYLHNSQPKHCYCFKLSSMRSTHIYYHIFTNIFLNMQCVNTVWFSNYIFERCLSEHRQSQWYSFYSFNILCLVKCRHCTIIYIVFLFIVNFYCKIISSCYSKILLFPWSHGTWVIYRRM